MVVVGISCGFEDGLDVVSLSLQLFGVIFCLIPCREILFCKVLRKKKTQVINTH